jgi:hypothetical protein
MSNAPTGASSELEEYDLEGLVVGVGAAGGGI